MIDTPQVVRSTLQIAAAIRVTIPRAQIRNVMGPGLQELLAGVAAQGIAVIGPWFTHHMKMDPDIFDFEIGVPVAAPVAAAGRIGPSQLPAVKVARTVYRGPYEGLSDGWNELHQWLCANGHTPAENLWERYVVGPESDVEPSQWQTELNRPVVD